MRPNPLIVYHMARPLSKSWLLKHLFFPLEHDRARAESERVGAVGSDMVSSAGPPVPTTQSHGAPAMARERFVRLLLIPAAVYLAAYLAGLWQVWTSASEYLLSPGMPFGGDFINQWAVAKLVVERAFAAIYQPDALMAFQKGFVGEDIGLRLWAYPPHSLFFVWPFGLGGFRLMYALWSVFGLAVLAAGSRVFGFSWKETVLLTLSPAALYCIAGGQTGNAAGGLLLIALARPSGSRSAAAAALLTVKPQIGFLLALLWLLDRRWRTILLAGVLAAALAGASVLVFGMEAWRGYLGVTLPALSELERAGEGTFPYVIPSLFMSLRLLGMEGSAAFAVHVVFALAVLAVLVLALMRVGDRQMQAALVLVATCLVTPYMHFYDLGILLAGMLMALRASRGEAMTGLLAALTIVAWALPVVIVPMGMAGLPLSPLFILAMFAAICVAGWDTKPSSAGISGNAVDLRG